jgi:hypothetical protein
MAVRERAKVGSLGLAVDLVSDTRQLQLLLSECGGDRSSTIGQSFDTENIL